MFYRETEDTGTSLRSFLDGFGINLDEPTVRDAVAFDLVKLDDDSVSNDYTYTSGEHVGYSMLEYERFLLNRNFRVNLVRVEPEWSRLRYDAPDGGYVEEDKRRMDCVNQGVRMSDAVLGYFGDVLDKSFSDSSPIEGYDLGKIYLPFTNANDFTAEVALIPNNRTEFPSITSRAYYDTKYLKYKQLWGRHGITSISTFALVDFSKDKTHTGWFKVKVQRKVSGGVYMYVVATVNLDG